MGSTGVHSLQTGAVNYSSAFRGEDRMQPHRCAAFNPQMVFIKQPLQNPPKIPAVHKSAALLTCGSCCVSHSARPWQSGAQHRLAANSCSGGATIHRSLRSATLTSTHSRVHTHEYILTFTFTASRGLTATPGLWTISHLLCYEA